MRLGVQSYTLRHEIKDLDSLSEALKFCKNAGASSVQLSHLPESITAKQASVAAKSTGLVICSTHPPFARIKDDLDRLADEHVLMGAKSIGVAMYPKDLFGPIEEGVERLADFLNSAAERLKPKGLFINYHNHDLEFRNHNGVRPYDTLLKKTSASVRFCLDVYWTKFAKANPLEYIEKIGHRLILVHMKDMGKLLPVMKAVGSGRIDYPEILRKASKYPVSDALVEIDIAKSPRDAVTKSLSFLKNAGF